MTQLMNSAMVVKTFNVNQKETFHSSFERKRKKIRPFVVYMANF